MSSGIALGTLQRRYHILGEIDSGGMGTVYCAKDLLSGTVALKRIRVTPHGTWGNAISSSVVSMDGSATSSGERNGGHPLYGRYDPTLSASGLLARNIPAEKKTEEPKAMELHFSHIPTTLPLTDSALEQSAVALRLALAQEFQTLASLRHPNIISVLDYGFDELGQPFYTMEFLKGARTIHEYAQAFPLERRIELLVQVLQALLYLHRRGVIHRDLKPANVLVIDGQVKVLDFGLAIAREQILSHDSSFAGTPAYMAPELILGSSPPSESSDLYAVGVIAYELLTGQHPFVSKDLVGLFQETLEVPPNLDPLDPRFSPVIGRLLAKSKANRYCDAADVIAALGAAIGKPIAFETVATRESFLQAARLVGRDAELTQLSHVLERAMGGEGGLWLIGGESGVGKSRLMEEIRVRALVSGALVMRGQAVSEGGGPYHPWREVLRWIALLCAPNELEAGVLKPFVPDIAALVRHDVEDPPELDPDAAQERLFFVVEDMLRRIGQPAVIVLEDWQWAGSDSTRMLARLMSFVGELRLLVLVSYRDDECPELPNTLPGVGVVRLRRLGPQETAALAGAMMGTDACNPELAERLLRETEGNPFFLVEVVRALAEETGQLDRIGVTRLPESVSPQRLQNIVGRRLERVAKEDRELLELAAVAGRQLDLSLIASLTSEGEVEAWLQRCADAAVLEVQDGRFRFAHDKLREGLIQSLAPEAHRSAHRRVAESIERVYPNASEHAAILAHHWAQAGDADKEAHYASLAGEMALQNSAYAEAISFFERALERWERYESVGAGARDSSGFPLLTNRVLLALRSFVGKRSECPSERLRRSRLEGQLAEAYGRIGDHAASIEHGKRAMELMGWPVPGGRPEQVAGVLGQAAVRALSSVVSMRFEPVPADERATLHNAMRIQTRITENCFYTQDSLTMLGSGLHMLNLGEHGGPSGDLARSYVMMGAVAGVIPLHAMAEAWFGRALSLAEIHGRPYDLGFVLQRKSAYDMWMARWDLALGSLERVLAVAERSGDRRQRVDALMTLGFTNLFQGNFARSAQINDEVRAHARRTGDDQAYIGALIGEAMSKVRLGEAKDGVTLCEEARSIIDVKESPTDVIWAYGVLAIAYLRSGDASRAREMADRVLDLILQTRPVACWTQSGLVGVAEVYLALWEALPKRANQEEREVLESLSRKACKAMRAFAGVFPIGVPYSLLFEGICQQLSGRSREASRTFRRAIAEAERLNMPYEEGRAHLELGRHKRQTPEARRRHLRRAIDIFTRLGAEHDRKRVEEELARVRH